MNTKTKVKKDPEVPQTSPSKKSTEISGEDNKEIRIIERVIENREIAPHDAFGKLNRAQVELIKRTYAKGASDDELKLFITACHGMQLSPFSKQVHLVPRWDSKEGKEVRAIQVGIDGLRATAEKTGKYAGNDDPTYEGEEVINYSTKEKAKNDITVPNQATVTVYKIVEGGRYGFTATARWKEYYPGPKMGFQWHQRPYLMLGKCAESLALRKAFPTLLSGIYTPEEMDRSTGEEKDTKNKQTAFQKLMAMLDTMTVAQMQEYKEKMEKSDKYTEDQKAEFCIAVEDKIKTLESKK